MYDLHGFEPLGGTFTCELCRKPLDRFGRSRESEDTIRIKGETGTIFKFHSNCILKLSQEQRKEQKL